MSDFDEDFEIIDYSPGTKARKQTPSPIALDNAQLSRVAKEKQSTEEEVKRSLQEII